MKSPSIDQKSLRASASSFRFSVNRASFLAGLEDVLDESCGGDAEDELVQEFCQQSRDNKRYDIVRLALDLLPLFGQVWLLTAGPLIGISVFFAELSK